MKNQLRNQKRSMTRREANLGAEINNALDKLLKEFEPLIHAHVKNDPDKGIVTFSEEYATHFKAFDMRWRHFGCTHRRTASELNSIVKVNMEAFVKHVSDYMDKRKADVKKQWEESIAKTIALNTAEELEYSVDEFIAEPVNHVAFEILKEKYFNVFNYNESLWIKNFFRKLFGYSPDYPVIRSI